MDDVGRVVLDLPKWMIDIVAEEAKRQRRSRKAELELMLSQSIQAHYGNQQSDNDVGVSEAQLYAELEQERQQTGTDDNPF